MHFLFVVVPRNYLKQPMSTFILKKQNTIKMYFIILFNIGNMQLFSINSSSNSAITLSLNLTEYVFYFLANNNTRDELMSEWVFLWFISIISLPTRFTAKSIWLISKDINSFLLRQTQDWKKHLSLNHVVLVNNVETFVCISISLRSFWKTGVLPAPAWLLFCYTIFSM